ncbi:MAG TPA: hypothetical protein VMV22_07300 [Acidimicrobiales bacterium]|nr:hypothetical protein [Acidimicrobiales bacterium]
MPGTSTPDGLPTPPGAGAPATGAPGRCRTDLSTVCMACGAGMRPEHAHYRCPACGWRDSCCDGPY